MANISFSATVLVALLLPAKSLFSGDTCYHDEQEGTCVLLTQCKPVWEEVQRAGRPMPMHIRRKLHDLRCGFEDDEQLVCCIPSSDGNRKNEGYDLDTAITNKPSSVTPQVYITETDVRSGTPPNVQRHRNIHLLPTDNCGFSEADRIFGGTKAEMFELPWMVLLSYTTNRGTKLSCGGTLISERYVLTAAHCVSFLSKQMTLNGVILGELDVTKDPDCDRENSYCAPPVRNVTIEEVIAHKNYSPQTLVDDIALLRLSEPADFTQSSMKPVCLPVTPELQNEDLEGVPATVAGWGATEDGLQSTSLLHVNLPIVGNSACIKAYHGSPQIYDWQLCAGGVQDKDSCGGDSGGPLTFPGVVGDKGERVVQRGIVSYGSKRCGIGGFPGVYTRVAYYMDWILDHIRE